MSKVYVRELNLIHREAMNEYLSTGEGKRKGFKEQRKYRVLWAGVAHVLGSQASADHVVLAGVWFLTPEPRPIIWPWQGFGP
jgi:hypothetical protein